MLDDNLWTALRSTGRLYKTHHSAQTKNRLRFLVLDAAEAGAGCSEIAGASQLNPKTVRDWIIRSRTYSGTVSAH